MKLILLSLVFVTSSALATETLEMDRPVYFTTAAEIYGLSAKPLRELDLSFGEAMTYLVTYADVDSHSGELGGALLLALAQGRSPRQIMVLGFALRLEGVKTAVAEDELRIANKERLSPEETVEQSKKLFVLRLHEGRGQINYLKSQIARLLKDGPSRSPEPTPSAVH